MKLLSRIVFTIIYLITVALIIYLPTRTQHFQGEIVKIEVLDDELLVEDDEDDNGGFLGSLFVDNPDIKLTIRDTNGKYYIVRVYDRQSYQYSNSDRRGKVEELKIGDSVKGTYRKDYSDDKRYAEEITLIVK